MQLYIYVILYTLYTSMYSLCMYTYSVCLHIRLIIYTHVTPGNTLPNLEKDSPRGAANSSIFFQDTLRRSVECY